MFAAGGCPDRHAYLLSEAFGSAHDASFKNGAPCDPARRAPFAVRLEIGGTNLTAFEAGQFWVRTREGSVPGWFPPDGLRVVQGKVAHAAENVPSPNSGSGNYFELLLDLNADGRCTPGEDLAWTGYPTEIDAEKFVVRFALTPPTEGDQQRCASVWK